MSHAPAPRKLRIAIWHNLPSGGGKRALFELVKGLVARGHAIESWRPPKIDQSYLPMTRLIPEHVVDLEWKDAPFRYGYKYLRYTYSDARSNTLAMDRHCQQCAAEMAAGKFDVLFAHPCALVRVASIGRHVDLPKILYLQEPIREFYEASPELPWLAIKHRDGWTRDVLKRSLKDAVNIRALRMRAREERDNAAGFDKILVNSFYSRESILRAYGLDARVSYLGVDTELFRPMNLPRERFVVGLGSLHPSKDVKLAVAAVAAIPAARRPSLHWIANFADPDYHPEVEALAMSSGVNFVAHINISDEDVVSLLNKAAVMIYTSRLEPFGLAPLEASACETPVVAIAEGGVRETIARHQGGTLVPERDPALVARALLDFLDDPGRARAVGMAARDNVLANWTWDRAVDNVERSLLEAAGT